MLLLVRIKTCNKIEEELFGTKESCGNIAAIELNNISLFFEDIDYENETCINVTYDGDSILVYDYDLKSFFEIMNAPKAAIDYKNKEMLKNTILIP